MRFKKGLIIILLLVVPIKFLHAQDTSACVGALTFCNNTTFSLDSGSYEIDEFSFTNNVRPTCYGFDDPRAWFRLEFASAGTFNFTLTPDQPFADYDFAIFGPGADCNNLGVALRCSSTAPLSAGISGVTGLNETERDFEEGPGANGNAFLRQLEVDAGEVYYLLVGLASGEGGFTIEAGGTATFNEEIEVNNIVPEIFCDDDLVQDGLFEIDLNQFDMSLTNASDARIQYFETEEDSFLNRNEISNPFINSSPSQIIYVRATPVGSECATFTSFLLRIDDSIIDKVLDTIFFCSSRSTQTINLKSYLSEFTADPSELDIAYYDSMENAINDLDPISPERTATRSLQESIIKFVDPTGKLCEFYGTVPYQVAPPPVFTTDPQNGQFCDSDYDDMLNARLSLLDQEILNGQDASRNDVFYFLNSEDRDVNVNAINDIEISSVPQTVYVEIRDNITSCFRFGEVSVRLNMPPFLSPQGAMIFCLNSNEPLILEVESGFKYYRWSNGTEGGNAYQTEVTAPGLYTVTVTNDLNCKMDLTLKVNSSEIARSIRVESSSFNSGSNTSQVFVTGVGSYEYNLDDGGYQNSNVFYEVTRGFHTVQVRDQNGCGITSKAFAVLDYNRFFTPNGDGFNDTWTLEGVSQYDGSFITIFDRYGKVVYRSEGNEIGWDGNLNGEPLPSSTYWFALNVPDREEVKGFFALKR